MNGSVMPGCVEQQLFPQHVKPHTLMFELGVDELTAQRILGHSRVEITREIYTQLREAQNRQSIEKFNTGLTKYSE